MEIHRQPQSAKKHFNEILTEYLNINGRYMRSNQSEDNNWKWLYFTGFFILFLTDNHKIPLNSYYSVCNHNKHKYPTCMGTINLASPTEVAEVCTTPALFMYLNFYSLKDFKITYISNVDSSKVVFMKPKVW